ncbi:helicase associated domain-containing protein [Embleya sp. NPDC020886]|uniref:helicase associated domain-containing protein n=1 Tax=Embleya sp. NPDC020886 TaxID=3363980 RepID=UPI0037B17C27
MDVSPDPRPRGLVPPPARGPIRLGPLAGETTLSFLDRLADRYRVGVRDFVPALLSTDSGLFKGYRVDGEVFLNAEARALVAVFCNVPPDHLRRALPTWCAQEPVGPSGAGPAGRFRFGTVLAAMGVGCRPCAAARTGRTRPVRLYLPPQARVCPRHRRWMLGDHRVDGALLGVEHVDLSGLPEILTAHRRHLRMLRHQPDAARAFEVAHAVVTSWWAQQWPREEYWPRRVRRITPPGEDPGWWRLLARDVVTYPETVAVASLLARARHRRRVLDGTVGHRPHTVADAPALVAELARRTERPWLPGHIAGASAGPLYTWLRGGARARAEGADTSRMWNVHMAHRPRLLARELQEHRDGARRPDEASRGPRLHPDRAFSTGLEHARAYAARHGHLAAPIGTRFEGFPLGRWLSNHRKQQAMPPEYVAMLDALDPWWKPSWTVKWQRAYYRAREQWRVAGGLRPEQGFPHVDLGLGEWLHAQCADYDGLHPAQRRLLAEIGLTEQAARTARPRRRNMGAHFERALACARAHVETDGTLVTTTVDTVRDGFPLGQWLANQRSKDRAWRLSHDTPSPRAAALSAIDPWWNPAWGPEWQRAHHRARTLVTQGHDLDPAAGFPAADDTLAAWLSAQCMAYGTLSRQQQSLLAGIGLTADRARAVEPRPRPPRTAVPSRPRPAESAASFSRGLEHARSYRDEHGTLAVVAPDTVHAGFGLGRWLSRRRAHARADMRGNRLPCPETLALDALDPWWCPSWPHAWQLALRRVRDHLDTGRPLDADHDFRGFARASRTWLRRQRAHYDDLHPGQRHLLAEIGLDREKAHTRPIGAHAETALTHARAYHTAHGNLIMPRSTVHDGFPLDRWLVRQRRLARLENTPHACHRALTAIDPWWNPPWNMRWQHAYQRAHTAHTLGVTDADTHAWTAVQRNLRHRLHPEQRALLARMGITATARTSQPAGTTTRVPPTNPGLAHARAYADRVGDLAVAARARHDDFPLGMWLIRQRARARRARTSPATIAALDTIDPWWNPPWAFPWQRAYHQARTRPHHDPEITPWIRAQHTNWPHLHPEQQHLLTEIGIHPNP